MQTVLRKSYNTTNKIYFFTATIHNWLPLLEEDNNQEMIIDPRLGSWPPLAQISSAEMRRGLCATAFCSALLL